MFGLRRSTVGACLAVLASLALALSHSAEIRSRAERGLGVGMAPREAALARSFVLGDEDEIDLRTTGDFRRAGLSHLLAVSGENVALLVLLALPLLAAFGLPLRTRLLWVAGLIVAYVPLAGSGPSILRAAVMGVLSLAATLAGRRASRLHALAVAALATLAIDPGIAADVGWQLSFAAVLGILMLARPLAEAIGRLTGFRGRLGRALAEGAALTIAATLATAPLVAFHFDELSIVGLVANLAALPAVAPAMWLGMLAAAAAQVPGIPVAPLNALCAPLLAYIAQVAAWCAAPRWACVHVELGLSGLAGCYAAIAAFAIAVPRLLRRRRLAGLRSPAGGSTRRPGGARSRARPGPGRPAAALAAAVVLLGLAAFGPGPPPDGPAQPPSAGLRISVLDVGQGDAILLQPAGARAVLVDGGPPGHGLVGLLRGSGVARLGAVIVTHDQSDHAGGVAELLASPLPVGRLFYGVLGGPLLEEARAAGVEAGRLSAGRELRSGALRLDVIWPPRELLDGPHAGQDPNLLALVAVARWRGFSMLLTADAEAESTPLDPGPVDVLKVAHHGSDDAGLAGLLDRTRPRLAVISVGEGNPYGHPTAATLATLARHGVPVLRTDRDGTIVLEVGRGSVGIRTDG